MKAWNALLSGAAGAVALTAMHECTRKTMPDPPRADLLGMRSIARISRLAGVEPPRHLRRAAFAGDLLANTAYYATVGYARPQHAIAAGAAAGILAGVGILALPGPLHLGSSAVNRTHHTQLMAAGMYLAAGLIAGATAAALAGRAANSV
jgi:hypothetical protein